MNTDYYSACLSIFKAQQVSQSKEWHVHLLLWQVCENLIHSHFFTNLSGYIVFYLRNVLKLCFIKATSIAGKCLKDFESSYFLRKVLSLSQILHSLHFWSQFYKEASFTTSTHPVCLGDLFYLPAYDSGILKPVLFLIWWTILRDSPRYS